MARKRDTDAVFQRAEQFRQPLEALFSDSYARQLAMLRNATTDDASPFDAPRWAARIADAMRPVYRRIMQASGRRWLRDLAPMVPQKMAIFEKQAPRRRVGQVLVDLEDAFADRLSQTILTTWDELAGIVQQAALESWTPVQIENALDDQWAAIFGDRLENITISETTGAINGIADYLSRELVELNDWLTANDNRVRVTHRIYGRAGSRPAGFNWAELVPGTDYTLLFPGDPGCSEIAEIARCRCILSPAAASEPVADDFDELQGLFRAGDPPSTKTPGPHKYATAQVELVDPLRSALLELAATIPEDDLAELGRETVPHVTVLYGLEDDDPEPVRDVVRRHGPVRMRLIEAACFEAVEGGTCDAVMVAVEDVGGLRELRAKLQGLPHAAPRFPYVPHLTLAYVKLGRGPELAADLTLPEQRAASSTQLVFRTRQNVRHALPLL